MSGSVTVTGMVLSSMPVGDYDKRLVLLTKERGKLTVFAKGARRPNSSLLAAATPFVFGSFQLYEGRNSYHMQQAGVRSYFTDLPKAQPEIYYGFYFLELADYYGQENADESGMLNLLYLSLKALMNPSIDNRLIRRVFELRTLVVQGEYPQVGACVSCGNLERLTAFSWKKHGMLCPLCAPLAQDAQKLDAPAVYALQYIVSVPLKKLYSFTIKPKVQSQLDLVVGGLMQQTLERKIKSQEILDRMTGDTVRLIPIRNPTRI